jgi:predicted negative regulator of RcsB-dependent stress response
MFDRTERLLSRGQRALSQRDFAGAESLLRAALASDPGYTHIRLYLAHALAEQEHRADAEAMLARATDEAPTSFVFPLHLGIIALDAGDHARARAALGTAARLAPGNVLVAAYAELAAWSEHRGPPSARLATLSRDCGSDSFAARALLRLAETTLETAGAKAAVALIEPAPDPPELPLALWLASRVQRDAARHAERLLARGRFEEAAWLVASRPELMTEPRGRELLARARAGLGRTLDAALVDASPARRRELLLRRYEVENDGGDVVAVVRTLEAWRQAYAADGEPSRQRPVAAAVTRRLAAIAIESGRYEAALTLCAESRHSRAERETAGIEALALLALGRRRAARHKFEDFLADALFPLDERLRTAAAGSAA